MPAIPELAEFRQLAAEKSAAKELALDAVGRAKLAESQGKDASAEWAIVAHQGLSGVEGEKFAAMQSLADATVEAHPELFAHLESYANPAGQDHLVKMASAFRVLGLEDEKTAVTMFELAHFERKQIGVVTQAQMRSARGGK